MLMSLPHVVFEALAGNGGKRASNDLRWFSSMRPAGRCRRCAAQAERET
ncbi:hypothetical protein ACU4GD_09880 [Cupriavidus basilensis]